MITIRIASTVLGMITLMISSLSVAKFSPKMICNKPTLHNAAWQMNSKTRSTFISNLTEPENEQYTKEQRVAVVNSAIKKYHSGVDNYTTKQIAKAIIWASDCTGNDFKWFAGIIGNESLYCKSRLGKGGDSGCGQFTGAAIDSIKLQLKLKSRPKGKLDTASSISTKAMENMVKSCYESYDGIVDGSEGPGNEELFYNVMNRSHKNLKIVFQKATAMHVDILASAIFLKFNAAIAGGYIIPGSRPGGIARYNGRGIRNYLRKVIRTVNRDLFIPMTYTCVEDWYTLEIVAFACQIDENPEACMAEFESKQSTQTNNLLTI